jgi:peptidyl-prolyl cis-trans isomerase D
MRIDAVTGKPARSLEQVRGEIVAVLSVEKRRTAVSDFTAEVQDEFDNGAALGDVAKELGVTVEQTDPLTADGSVFGRPGIKVKPQLATVLTTAFGKEQGDNPEIAEIVPGKAFIIFDVATVTASAPAPLAEIREQVAADFAVQQGAKDARAAADRALAAVKKGGDLAQAMSGIAAPIPPVDQVTMRREELVRMQQQVPPPLRLLFNMAAGTTKILPAPRNRGFYIVQLKKIELAEVAKTDPLIPAAKRELSQTAGREYAEQLRVAIRAEVGVERNSAAVKALNKTLTGSGR